MVMDEPFPCSLGRTTSWSTFLLSHWYKFISDCHYRPDSVKASQASQMTTSLRLKLWVSWSNSSKSSTNWRGRTSSSRARACVLLTSHSTLKLNFSLVCWLLYVIFLTCYRQARFILSIDVPYIANWIYEHPGLALNLKGIWIADPSLSYGVVQQEIPALRFIQVCN